MGSKRVTVRVVELLDASQRILKQTSGNLNAQGPYVFDKMTFEPLKLSELGIKDDSGSDSLDFTVYGRTDTRLHGLPAGHVEDVRLVTAESPLPAHAAGPMSETMNESANDGNIMLVANNVTDGSDGAT